jgi:hypothetical protein
MNNLKLLKEYVDRIALFVEANYEKKITEEIQLEFDILSSQYVGVYAKVLMEKPDQKEIKSAQSSLSSLLKTEEMASFYQDLMEVSAKRFVKKQTWLN